MNTNKQFHCWAWSRDVKVGEVAVEAINGYEAQKKAARKLGVKMLRVRVKELALISRNDLFVCL